MAVYVDDTIRDFTYRRYDLESVDVENIWLQVKIGGGPPIFLASVYRNPFSGFVWFDEFISMMDRAQDHKHINNILLLGDFGNPPSPALMYTSVFNRQRE